MSEQKSGQGLIWLLVILSVVNVGLSYMTFTMAGGSLSMLMNGAKQEMKEAAGKATEEVKAGAKEAVKTVEEAATKH